MVFTPPPSLIILAHQHKLAGMKTELSKNNDHDGVSHGVKCSKEGDRISPLKSNGQSLEQQHRLYKDVSTSFLDQLCG